MRDSFSSWAGEKFVMNALQKLDRNGIYSCRQMESIRGGRLPEAGGREGGGTIRMREEVRVRGGG